MTLLRSLVIVGVSSLVLVGCGKKSQETPDEAIPEETVSKNSSDDLFDEFYEETESTQEESSNNSEITDEYIEEEYSSSNSYVPSLAPRFSLDGRYVVQVSCIASEEIAEDVAKKFENYGYPVYVAEVLNPTPQLLGKYFRIRIGGFDNLTDANSFGNDHLMPTGFEFWVDNRSNDNVGIGDFGLGDDDFSFEETPAAAEPVVEEAVENVVEEVIEESSAAAEEVATETSEIPSDDDDVWGTSEW